MDYNNVWILRVMCLNLSLSCFIKHYPEKFHHFLCCNYAEHWRLCAENKILDILPERYKPYSTTYFGKYPKEELKKVKYFVLDMWRTYYDTAGMWFKNAIRIADKCHWICSFNLLFRVHICLLLLESKNMSAPPSPIFHPPFTSPKARFRTDENIIPSIFFFF